MKNTKIQIGQWARRYSTLLRSRNRRACSDGSLASEAATCPLYQTDSTVMKFGGCVPDRGPLKIDPVANRPTCNKGGDVKIGTVEFLRVSQFRGRARWRQR